MTKHIKRKMVKGERGFKKLFYGGKEVKGVNNSTMIISIPTPKNWKCKMSKCRIDYKHSHTNFSSLKE